MEAFSIGKSAGRRGEGNLPGGGALIDALGERGFAPAFFAAAHELSRCRHLSAFAFARRQPPRLLLAEDCFGGGQARAIAEDYCAKYWPLDLANKIAADPPRASREGWRLLTSAAEIGDGDYQDRCYRSAGLTQRLCISRDGAEENIRINFYAPAGGDFLDSELQRLFGWSDVFLSLMRKHDVLRADRAPAPDVGLAEALRRLPAALPTREIEVCEGIVQGVSSEGIALRLGLSINTVRTYRKRAYARLGISSQNELMRLVARPLDA